MTAQHDTFGPFRPNIDPVERIAQLRSLAALALVFRGHGDPLVDALRDAERDEAAAQRALELLDSMPALTRRRLLATFGAVTWPRQRAHSGDAR